MAHTAPLTPTKVPPPNNGPAAPPWRWGSHVAVTTAVLAVLASITTLMSGHHTDQAVIEQIQASDQWAYYQAKGIKGALVANKMEMLPILGKEPSDQDRRQAERYATEQAEIKTKADGLQTSADVHRAKHATFAKGVTAFQIAIGLCAIALLIRRSAFWLVAIACGAIGIVFGVWGFLPNG